MLDFSGEVLLAYAQDFGKKYLGLQASIQEHHIVRAENAISCYPVGHYKVLGFLEEQKSRIQLLGSGFHGVAVGDSVEIAKRAANQF
jgi:protoporphyrinogen oxidase